LDFSNNAEGPDALSTLAAPISLAAPSTAAFIAQRARAPPCNRPVRRRTDCREARSYCVMVSARKDFPVVCVGDLSGGLASCIRLLTCLPKDLGVAIVIVNPNTQFPTQRQTALPK
jgi:chemotaxis response regulator CheB